MSTARDIIGVDEMRGLYLHDGYAPFIAINRRDWVKSQLFSLAHELAHLFRADEKIDSIAFRDLNHINDPGETFCNRVASALLIPASSLTNQETWSLERVKKLSQKHQVSDLVGLYRLAEAGLIKPQDKQRFARQLNREYQDYIAQKKPARPKPAAATTTTICTIAMAACSTTLSFLSTRTAESALSRPKTY